MRGATSSARVPFYNEMASGTPAFPQRQIARLFDAILHEDPPPLTAVNPFVPLALERVVMQAIAKNPMDRQASAAELSEALVALTRGNRGREAAVARRHDGWWTRLTAVGGGGGGGPVTVAPLVWCTLRASAPRRSLRFGASTEVSRPVRCLTDLVTRDV